MTNVRFSHDLIRVISVGGADHAVFQWRYLPDGPQGDDGDDEADGGAYLESNSEDSDSELSDADELDSDIENVRAVDKFISYSFFTPIHSLMPNCSM